MARAQIEFHRAIKRFPSEARRANGAVVLAERRIIDYLPRAQFKAA